MFQTKIICKGKVQGVGFRYATKEKAIALGLSGNVTNLEDGSVVINASGPIADITRLIDWCHVGPTSSSVKELIISYQKTNKNALIGFSIIR